MNRSRLRDYEIRIDRIHVHASQRLIRSTSRTYQLILKRTNYAGITWYALPEKPSIIPRALQYPPYRFLLAINKMKQPVSTSPIAAVLKLRDHGDVLLDPPWSPHRG